MPEARLDITRNGMEITGERLRTLNDDSVRWWLALDRTPAQIALQYGVAVAKVEKAVEGLRRTEARRAEQAQALRQRLDRALSGRPMPPDELCDPGVTSPLFRPDRGLEEWARETFVEGGGPLANPDHAHLAFARIGFLWTNVPNRRGMRPVAGQAEMPRGQGGKWAKGRADFQMCQWFGEAPDFLITLFAPYCAQSPDATFCALTEHELYHCGQAEGEEGPKFNKDEEPVLALRGHDAEEHVGVVRRYGVGAAAGGVAELVRAASFAPQIAPADIAAACGNCLR